MLYVYYVCFALVQFALVRPSIAARVAELQSGSRGNCLQYGTHMVVHGPLYVFFIGSILFWVQLLQSPSCELLDPQLYQNLKFYATESCLVSLLCALVAYWHSKLIRETWRCRQEHE